MKNYIHTYPITISYGLHSGFRKRHSTETALIRLLDLILHDLDKNHVTGVVFVDYSKAFYLIDHQLLLQKLSAYGVDDTYIKISVPKLLLGQDAICRNKRLQIISVIYITHGVPQGTILGPLLFLAFINDLPPNIPDSTVDENVDDTTFSSSSHFSVASIELQVNLQRDINKLCQ